MTRKSKARYGMNRTYKLNAAVKALRSALFAGMAMAAVAPAAQAACTVVDNTITCTGAFGSTLNFGPGDVALPFDPTIIQLDAGTDIDVTHPRLVGRLRGAPHLRKLGHRLWPHDAGTRHVPDAHAGAGAGRRPRLVDGRARA